MGDFSSHKEETSLKMDVLDWIDICDTLLCVHFDRIQVSKRKSEKSINLTLSMVVVEIGVLLSLGEMN